MADLWPSEVEARAYVADVENVQLKLRVPAPVVVLTAELLKQLPRRAGVRNASELIAALLVRAREDTEALADVIGDYRETRVHSILDPNVLDPLVESATIVLPPRSDVELG
jgi:hypothetical protein